MRSVRTPQGERFGGGHQPTHTVIIVDFDATATSPHRAFRGARAESPSCSVVSKDQGVPRNGRACRLCYLQASARRASASSGGIFAFGCSQSPTAPSQSATAASPTSSGANLQPATQQANLSIEDLESRGWDCRPAPFAPTRTTCSRPNQPHPLTLTGPPPPLDRPASITLLVFDNGAFIGTSLLIRSDLYQDQPCSSTNNLYTFIGRIGYYECLHRSQAS